MPVTGLRLRWNTGTDQYNNPIEIRNGEYIARFALEVTAAGDAGAATGRVHTIVNSTNPPATIREEIHAGIRFSTSGWDQKLFEMALPASVSLQSNVNFIAVAVNDQFTGTALQRAVNVPGGGNGGNGGGGKTPWFWIIAIAGAVYLGGTKQGKKMLRKVYH